MVDVKELLMNGGEWLGAARGYLQWRVLGGERCILDSDDVLQMTVRQIEELAAYAVVADGGYQMKLEECQDERDRLNRRLGAAKEIIEIQRKTIEHYEAVSANTHRVIVNYGTLSDDGEVKCAHCDTFAGRADLNCPVRGYKHRRSEDEVG